MDVDMVDSEDRAASPAEFIARDPSRFQLLHIKDMILVPGSKEPKLTIMGKGNIDYKPVLRAATHLKYYFIEQEAFDGDPMQEPRTDADYIKNFNYSNRVPHSKR